MEAIRKIHLGNRLRLGGHHSLFIMMTFAVSYLLYAIIYDAFRTTDHQILAGFLRINLVPGSLIVDFISVGGIAGAFLNTAIIAFMHIYMMKRMKVYESGIALAAFLTLLGFTFIGKTVYTVVPFYIGGYLYSRWAGIDYRSIFLSNIFATSLSPIVSFIAFHPNHFSAFSILLSYAVGILLGFIFPSISKATARFHRGLNLYNAGFASGFLGMIFTGVVQPFGLTKLAHDVVFKEFHLSLWIIHIGIFTFMALLGALSRYREDPTLSELYRAKGFGDADFANHFGHPATFANMGILGLFSLFLILLLRAPLNGATLTAILTFVGFGAYGQHLKNCIPVFLGVFLAGLIYGQDITSTSFCLTMLFSATLAPMAGVYGTTVGIISGLLHVTILPQIVLFHGGFNLYNNGMSGGMVASIFAPIVESVQEGFRARYRERYGEIKK